MKYRTNDRNSIVVSSSLLAFACVLAFAPDAFVFMLARAFLLQWAMVMGAIAIFFVLRRDQWVTMAALAAIPMLLVQVRMPELRAPLTDHRQDLRIAHMNVFQFNSQRRAAIEVALSSAADLISVQEVDGLWARDLTSALAGAYPFSEVVPRGDCYGIALFSRIPFEELRTLYVEGTPFIEVVLKVGGDPVRVLVVHATSPTDRDDLRRRNRQLDQLAQRVGAVRLPTVLVGDLNTVHWDAAYARLCRRSGLITVDGGLCTWPALGPAALMPLDHVLASADIRPGEVRSFHVPGSDHRGLLADLNIAHHVP